jgi:hypothetical protein
MEASGSHVTVDEYSRDARTTWLGYRSGLDLYGRDARLSPCIGRGLLLNPRSGCAGCSSSMARLPASPGSALKIHWRRQRALHR